MLVPGLDPKCKQGLSESFLRMVVTWKERENICHSETEGIKIPCILKLLEALLQSRGEVCLKMKSAQMEANQSSGERQSIFLKALLEPLDQPYLKLVQPLDISVT